ncbi:MAG TPA: LLM class flavin-dependent oxidoreductase [Candidatus Micrarchaeia archaeon]|nr:LLM class flavin-dependent oxidoreductase [Candidatus Micrarchaeia archaeon]
MDLGFGLITCQRVPGERRTDEELYRQAIELAVLADQLGIRSVWVSEHHFVDDGYLPALLPLCAAIAARTERVTIGTGLLLAPLHEPVRLAEDAAVVDLLSGGRLILGLGLGWRAEELAALRIPTGERGQLLEDTVVTLRQAWAGQPVEGGRLVRYPQVLVTPRPARPGGPPLWIGAMAEPAVRRAGRIGDGLMATEVTPGGLARQLGWALAARRAAGRQGQPFTASVHVPVFVWEGPDAFDRVLPHHHYVAWKYGEMEHRRYGLGGRRALPPPPTAEELGGLRDTILAGPPEQVAEGIQSFADRAGRPLHFIARAYWPGMDPGVQRETLRLLGERVLPLLRGSR